MATKFYIIKDTYVTGDLPANVGIPNPVRPEILIEAEDALESSSEGTLADPKLNTYESVKFDVEGICRTTTTASQTKLDALVLARPDLYAGDYATRDLAIAARTALIPQSNIELLSGGIEITGLIDKSVVPSADATWATVALSIPTGATVASIVWTVGVDAPTMADLIVFTEAEDDLSGALVITASSTEGETEVIVTATMIVNGYVTSVTEAVTLTVASASS